MEVIRSKDNPKVKRFALLHDRKKAAKEGLVFIEGMRICEDALMSGVVPVSFVYSEDRADLASSWIERYNISCEIVCVTSECFSKIASTVNPQGVALVARIPDMKIEIPRRADGKDIFVVLENLQDPGNLGTILRTAEAAGASGILLSQGCADLYNPKVTRSTMGSIFRVPFVYTQDLKGAIVQMKECGVRILAAHLKGSVDLYEESLTGPTAILIGNESRGLTDETAALANQAIRIPMSGRVESLNAAVATAVCLFEAKRQRRIRTEK